MGPREDDLRPLRRFLDRQQICPDPVALAVAFAADLLARGQKRLGPPEVDHYAAALDLLYVARDDLADPVLEIAVDLLPLRLTDPLHDDLLRRLDRVSSELVERHLDPHHVPDLQRRVEFLRLLQVDLEDLILGCVDDRLAEKDAYRVVVLVDDDLDLGRRTVLLARGGEQSGLQRFRQKGAVQLLLARDPASLQAADLEGAEIGDP